MLRTAFIVKSVIGTMPCITPNDDLRPQAEAAREQHDRIERDLGNRVEAHHQRLHHVARQAPRAEQQAEAYAADRRYREADANASDVT